MFVCEVWSAEQNDEQQGYVNKLPKDESVKEDGDEKRSHKWQSTITRETTRIMLVCHVIDK